MSLIQCLECGHPVSDKATSCPICGCPVDIKTYRKLEQEYYEYCKAVVLGRGEISKEKQCCLDFLMHAQTGVGTSKQNISDWLLFLFPPVWAVCRKMYSLPIYYWLCFWFIIGGMLGLAMEEEEFDIIGALFLICIYLPIMNGICATTGKGIFKGKAEKRIARANSKFKTINERLEYLRETGGSLGFMQSVIINVLMNAAGFGVIVLLDTLS